MTHMTIHYTLIIMSPKSFLIMKMLVTKALLTEGYNRDK